MTFYQIFCMYNKVISQDPISKGEGGEGILVCFACSRQYFPRFPLEDSVSCCQGVDPGSSCQSDYQIKSDHTPPPTPLNASSSYVPCNDLIFYQYKLTAVNPVRSAAAGPGSNQAAITIWGQLLVLLLFVSTDCS